MSATQTPPITSQTVLADRFISTEVERFTLVFPAVWVAEILQIDRADVLVLPFYDPLVMGIVHYNGAMIPLIAAAGLLKAKHSGTQDAVRQQIRQRAVVIKLNEAAGSLANVGIVVDRAIGSNTRQELPPDIFTTTNAAMVMMDPSLIPPNVWQPRG